MINVSDFIEKESKGLAQIVEAGGGYAIAVKKFNPETGEQISPEITALELGELEKQVADLQAQIVNLQSVIVKVKSLNVPTK